ncbi:MAG: hypothetical protein V3R72_00240 [Gammaproteobacteria bacterium]
MIRVPRSPAGWLALISLATVTGIAGAAQTPPTGAHGLLPWLQAGHYRQWQSESRAHASTGPHFGKVRAYLNPPLAASLGAGNGAGEHPRGAAAVKELFGMGETVRGWAVSLKLDSASAGGSRWYWFEYFDGQVVADARGAPLCAGCHEAGRDFVLIPWPLH